MPIKPVGPVVKSQDINDNLAFLKDYTDKKISSVNASPKGIYATLSALQAAIPNGDNNIYIVQTDGNWYYWNGTVWSAGGVYQSSGIADKSVTYSKQGVISVNDDKFMIINKDNNVSHLYKNEWVNSDNSSWGSANTTRSVICPIFPKSTIKIETKGSHDRFTVFASKFPTYSVATERPRKIYVKNNDGISIGNETYEFENIEDTYLIIGISSNGVKPTVIVTQTFEEGAKGKLDKLEKELSIDLPPLTNAISNGDFSNGTTGWVTLNASVSSEQGVAKMIATAVNGRLNQTLPPRVSGNKYYITFELKATSKDVVLTINGGSVPNTNSSGRGVFERISTTYTAPSSTAWYVGVQDKRSSSWNEVEVKNFVLINLTAAFGEGKEPDSFTMDRVINDYLGGFFSGTVSNYITIKKMVEKHEEELKNIKIELGNVGLSNTKDIYPVLFGVKMSNERDVTTGDPEPPRAIGWLYYIPTEPYEILYANGSPENMKHLCYWKKEVTWNGSSTPQQYRPFITKDGDIIFVWRGDELGMGSGIPNVRQNPIVYPSGDWNNPVEVELTGEKPTSWLQNCGADYIYNQDIFMFAEYTRPSHLNCYTWKVAKPFTDPSNWRIVQSFELSGNSQTGMKHLHTVNYDTFSGKVFTTTGDDDSAAKVFMSRDYGETWEVVLEGSRRQARVLNFIFTKEKVYWANDDGSHGFFSIERDPITHVPDFSNVTELHDLTGYPPTYVNCLIEDEYGKPFGILILNRHDGNALGPLKIPFWHIPTNTMHDIAETYSVGGVPSLLGFRVEACNYYHSKGERKIVAGFGSPKNSMDFLGNVVGDSNMDRINNLALEVVPSGETFKLKVSAINDRR